MLVEPTSYGVVVIVVAVNRVAGGKRRVRKRFITGGVNAVQTDGDKVGMGRVVASAVCHAEELDVGVRGGSRILEEIAIIDQQICITNWLIGISSKAETS